MSDTTNTNGAQTNGTQANGTQTNGAHTNGTQFGTNVDPLRITPQIGTELAMTPRIIELAREIKTRHPVPGMDLQTDKLTSGTLGNPEGVDILLQNGYSDFGDKATRDESIAHLERRLASEERREERMSRLRFFDWSG